MSIINRVRQLVSEDRLSLVVPLDPGSEVKRIMAVSEDIRGILDGPWPDLSMERRAYRLRADLEAFVSGHVLAVSRTPYEHRSAYMGLLDPPAAGFWDIRSRDPKPGLRVMGHFACVDLFVALVWRPRSVPFGGRSPLGDVQDLNWEMAKLQCEEAWKQLFPQHVPRTGGNIDDLISESKFLV